MPEAIEEIKTRKIDSFLSELILPPDNSNLRMITSLMTEKGVREVLFPEKQRCSIITIADILRCTSIEKTKPDTLMSHLPVLATNATVAQTARLMIDYRIESVPVSNTHEITGQVNSSSFLQTMRGKLGGLTISSIATETPVAIDASDYVSKARDLMVRKRINHLPVTERGKLVGLVTSAQIIELISPRERIGAKSMNPEVQYNLDFSVRDVMDAAALTCSPQTDAEHALNQMVNMNKTCVLVAQWDELQAITTKTNFIKLLAEEEKQPSVPTYIVGLPKDPFEAEMAKQKFKRTITQLQKVVPELLEARSIIKSKKGTTENRRTRYEVTVHIKTSNTSRSYAASGWDLSEVYDTITDRLKRLQSQKRKHFTRERE